MPDSLMSWGHTSMLSNVKKLFKKGPSSPSSREKRSCSPISTDSSSSNGNSNARGRWTHSNGHERESSVSGGYPKSRERRQHDNHSLNGQVAGHPSSQDSTSNGHSSINQLFPTSPRATGFDDYYSSENASPKPASPAPSKFVKSSTKPGPDPMLKVMQVLGVSKDELVDFTKVEYDGDYSHDNYDSVTESEDDESSTDTPAISCKSEIPPSFEFHRPPAKVLEEGANLSEATTIPRSTTESQQQNVSFKFGLMNGTLEANIRSGEELQGTGEPASAPTKKTTALYTARLLSEQVNGNTTDSHASKSHSSPEGKWRPLRECCAVESRLHTTHSEEGHTELNGASFRPVTPYSPNSNQRLLGARDSGLAYRNGEETGAEYHYDSHHKVCKKSPGQSHSTRSNAKLSNGLQSPRSQCSPRGTAWAPNGSHSPEGRSWGSNSSPRARQDGSWGSNGSASPQWGHSGYPSPDGCIRSDRNHVHGHPLPAPPPLSSPQHHLYVPTPVRVHNYQESSNQGVHKERAGQAFCHRPTSPSSQCVPPRMPPLLSPLASPLPSPPRSPLLSSPRPLSVPYSPRSPLPVPPLSRYSSPPRSPSRAQKIPSKWAKIREIGTGSFGTVHEAMNLDDGSFFAVKISRGETITAEIQKEIEVLSYLKHPNVVQYYGTGQEDGHLCIFLELMQNSLQSIIKHFQFFDETLISTYTRQILQGLEYLHKKNTIHRDIKCANILVDKDGQVKLADFGLAKEVGLNPATSCKGTPYFMAPEILRPDKTGKKGYGLPVDIWSLGCTVLEMATGKPPWSGSIGYSWFFTLFRRELPPIPPHLSPACVDFIRRCLSFKEEDRPTASELLRHPFVANADSPPAIVSGSLRTRPTYVSPLAAPVFRSGSHSDQGQSRCSGGVAIARVQKSPSPPSPRSAPRLERRHRLERTLSRSYSNPSLVTGELEEAIHAPRTPPPATTTSDHNTGTCKSTLQLMDEIMDLRGKVGWYNPTTYDDHLSPGVNVWKLLGGRETNRRNGSCFIRDQAPAPQRQEGCSPFLNYVARS